MKFHWAHQLMNVHFLLVGCLYFGLVIGVDQTPRKLPSLAKLGYIMAAMPFHAFFGVILMSGGIIGEEFYQHLDLPWARDLAGTQQAGGGVAWAGGEIPLLIVVIVLALQWAIQDKKEARRLDRHLDSGLTIPTTRTTRCSPASPNAAAPNGLGPSVPVPNVPVPSVPVPSGAVRI